MQNKTTEIKSCGEVEQANKLINKNGKLLLFRMSALGDIVLWTPVVKAIQRKYPDLEITWAISPTFYPLLEGMPGVNFIKLEKRSGFAAIAYYWRMLHSKTYDVLLLGQASLRAHLISMFIRARRRIGFGNLHAKDGHKLFVREQVLAKPEHLLDSYMQFARHLGVEDCHIEWDLPINDSDRQWAAEKLSTGKRCIAINAMASKAERNWSLSKLAKTITLLQENFNCSVVLTGGSSKAEKSAAEYLQANSTEDCLDLVGKTTLKQLAAVLEKVDILIAPDTGPLHLAVAMGTSVIGLHAVVPAEKSGAYGQQRWAIDHYRTAVKEILRKKPNKVKWGERVHDKRAMDLITVNEVIFRVQRIFRFK